MMAQAEILEYRPPMDLTTGQALRGVWEEFVGSIESIEEEVYRGAAEMQSVLNHNMVLLHKLLLSASSYRELVNSSFRKLVRTKYWGLKTIHQDDIGKIGVFSVYRNAPIPLHDHPGTKGVLMVLEGEVEVERYSLDEQDRAKAESGKVELHACEKQVLKPYEITWFGKEEGNIHGMQSLSDQCVLLKVQLPASADAGRSWYFPFFGDEPGDQTIKARRILSRYL